jgi:hypothetical protein
MTCQCTTPSVVLPENTINFFTTHDIFDLCIDCTYHHIFKKDTETFVLVLDGTDTSCKYKGVPYYINHEGTIQFEAFPEDYYPQGAYCACCQNQVLEPPLDENGFSDNYSQSEENKEIYADFQDIYGA